MFIEKIKLNENTTLTAYIGDTGYKRDAVLVIPGGGYCCVCADREGEPVALAFLGKGINAFVLDSYSINENAVFPNPLIDASLAMKHIKDNADKYSIDKDRVFACGLSAGGHLCAALGSLWHLDLIYEKINMEYGYNKPKGIIPCYPVINGEYPHLGSFQNLTGKEAPSKEELESVSIDRFVSEKSVPAFITHTANDQVVPVENALLLAMAYSKANIPFALHVFPDSPHGSALGNKITSKGKEEWIKKDIEQWVDMALYWMEELK